MVDMSDISWIVGPIVLGLLIGSFLNVVIHRLPSMADGQSGDNGVTEIEGRSRRQLTLASPRSQCPSCGHRLRARENIPVLSYCLLRGRCSACNERISLRYPIVEILGAVGALGAVLMLGATPQGLAAMVFVWFAIAIAFIDLEHYLIPDLLALPLLWLGLGLNAFGLFVSPSAAILGAIVGYVAFWVINALAARVLQRTAIGNGDFKLFAAIGAWLGWEALAPSLLIASALGASIGYALLWSGRRPKGRPICFAPFLLVGASAVLFSGGRISIWLASVFAP
ncbi:MAG: prepilin peptidase [Proteobacteria bacterium]|nr:prepilin peptidase [Pseudomonadota bacterium]